MKSWLTYVTLSLSFIIVSSFVTGCESDAREYVRLSKTTFEKLVKNDPSAADLMDWNSLRCNDQEVGQAYMSLTTDYEKSQIKVATVEKLSQFYASHGWDVTNVRNWKLQSKGVESGIVTADAPGGSITIYFQKVGLDKKISRILNQ